MNPQNQTQQHPPVGPAPSERRTTLWALAAVSVVAVVALVIVLVVTSKDDAAEPRTYKLGLAINVELTVPAGWRAYEDVVSQRNAVVLVPEGDARSGDEIERARDDIDEGRTAEPVHMVTIFADPCPTKSVDSWEVSEIFRYDSGSGNRAKREMQRLVRRGDCIQVDAIDMAASGPETSASDLLNELAKDGVLTMSVDSSRPSVRRVS